MFACAAMEKNDDGWDLFAVVRSCRASSRPPAKPVEALLTISYDETEKFGKPFFSKAELPKQSPLSCSSSLAGAAAPSTPRRPLSQTISRSKKRRNQQKRVVCEVPADGLAADMWAWRKYGQKPIKGSPYPRGYYRCSSSKGCLARKQVERSRTDPAMFVITYTGEHNHSLPIHRNSLAGSTRQKFSSAAAVGEQGGRPEGSPNTPLKREESGEEEEEDDEEEEDEGILLVEDMEVVGEDEVLLLGMEKLQESPEAASVMAGEFTEFFNSESCCFDDSFFLHSWSEESNSGGATAAAGR